MGSRNKGSRSKDVDRGRNVFVPDTPVSPAVGFFRDHKDAGICIALFLSALFVIITISNPGMYLRDEWITVNQLHQLDMGHQITINEGKYGVFKNGTPSEYFAFRSNILMYSAALPLSSWPAMKLIDLFGNNFRLALLLFWASLPFFIALIISFVCPSFAWIGSLRITLLGAITGCLLFVGNLLYYSPFVYSASDAPVEVAAVVFTNHLFFAFTIAVIYLIAYRIFEDRWKSLFAACAGASCSAYLFWGANAKDHMATAAIFAIVIYFFVCYIRSGNFRDAAGGFGFIGILAWFRPEVGFSAFLCIGVYFVMEHLMRIWQKRESLKSGAIAMSAIVFTAVGSIPFFINNFVATGNPIVPLFLLEEKIKVGGTVIEVAPGTTVSGISSSVSATPQTMIGDFVATISHWVFSISPDPLSDLFGILFFPKSGSMGLFIIVPVALLAFVLCPLVITWMKKEKNTFSRNTELALFLLVAAFSVFLAYIHSLESLNMSLGIGPDIRYLSPEYIPVVLISLMVLEKTILFAHPRELVKRSCVMGIFLVPVLLATMIVIIPIWSEKTSNYFLFFDVLILAEVMGIALLAFIYHAKKWQADSLSDICIPLVVLTILSWQIMMIVLVSPVLKFNGYTFWIPGVDTLYHSFITVTILK